MSPRRRQRCRREREKGSRAHRSGRGDAAEPAARQFPFLQPSGAVVSVGRPLTPTGEVLPVCHGRKLSLLSLRPRGGPRLTRQKDPREAWQCFAGLIGPLSGRSTRRCTAKATPLSTTCSCCASTSTQTTRRARCSGGPARQRCVQEGSHTAARCEQDTITNIQLQEQLKVLERGDAGGDSPPAPSSFTASVHR